MLINMCFHHMLKNVNAILMILNGKLNFKFSDKGFFMRNGKCYLENYYVAVYKENKCNIGEFAPNNKIKYLLFLTEIDSMMKIFVKYHQKTK